MGWKVVNRPPMLLKVLNPGRFLWSILMRRRSVSPAGPDLQESILPASAWDWQAFESRYGSRAIDAFIGRWESERKKGGYRTPRDLTYLRWRYGGHPTLKYGVFTEEDEEGLAGMAILRPGIRGGLKELVLSEFFLSEPGVERGQRFLRKMLAASRADYLVGHFSEGSFEKELLRRSSFRAFPFRPMTFTVRPLATLPVDPTLTEAWDLSLGDLELF
jgi:hypothetical protein